MKKRLWSTLLPVCLALAMIMTGVGAVSAQAAMDEASFLARYEQNAQKEATLLQEAKPLMGTSQTTASSWTTVTDMNQQIASLYVAQQQLVAESAQLQDTLTSATTSASLVAQRSALQTTLRDEWAEARAPKTPKATRLHLRQEIQTQRRLVQSLNRQIFQVNAAARAWLHAPFGGGLAELDASILHLQQTTIAYTSDLIVQADAAAGSQTTSN